ncbi:hypothetical protein LTR97_000847 [Elasticomyces elasticus]|uniref:Uncharacterized protein n=1 Tax=Elasticomyces elasticus TaxID=574655 RepID=A0AAN7VXZ0_9PEZI|nr:hypothetical protein LTR97_000847 [Elasticomyces elasticus]
MPPKKIYYIYNPNKPHTAEEELVISAAEFSVALVVNLTYIPHSGERLFNHSHHSKNTHYVVSGSIQVSKSHDNDFRFRPDFKFPGDWIDVPSNVTYIGVPGKEGCTFVEGHTLLSPTTAERMLGRDAIIEAPKTKSGAFTTEEDH